MITVGALNDATGVRHGFFTRVGGVSRGLYSSLNCGFGSGDSKDSVTENRARAISRFDLPPERLTTVYQVHSPKVVVVEEPWTADAAPEADAMVTAGRRIVLGILTADCAPVLFADTRKRVVGAAHAGWRGALDGVLEATISQMVGLGARLERIVAVIGPCIAQRSYEVGQDFRDRFVADSENNADFFAPSRRPGHAQFDLVGYVARRIVSAGVETVQNCPNDTVAEADRFFSYRRSVLRGEPDYGRGLSAIVID